MQFSPPPYLRDEGIENVVLTKLKGFSLHSARRTAKKDAKKDANSGKKSTVKMSTEVNEIRQFMAQSRQDLLLDRGKCQFES